MLCWARMCSPTRRPSILGAVVLCSQGWHALLPLCSAHQNAVMIMQVASSAAHPVFAEMLRSINAVLDKDVASSKTPFVNRTQQCFAVKTGTDSFLDLARSSFCRISEDVHKLAAAYSEQFKLTLKVIKAHPSASKELA